MSETSIRATELFVDPERCEGHARCLADAPGVFGYGDVTNQAFVLPGVDVDAHREQIEAAIAGCPEGAISWRAKVGGS